MFNIHWDEALMVIVVYYIYNAFVQALPMVEEVKNPWAKFLIRFAHGLAGNFGIFLWGQPKRSVIRQVAETGKHAAHYLREAVEKGKPNASNGKNNQ